MKVDFFTQMDENMATLSALLLEGSQQDNGIWKLTFSYFSCQFQPLLIPAPPSCVTTKLIPRQPKSPL